MHAIEPELETGRLKVLGVECFPIEHEWYVIQRNGEHLSPAAVAFKEFMLIEAACFIRLPDDRI